MCYLSTRNCLRINGLCQALELQPKYIEMLISSFVLAHIEHKLVSVLYESNVNRLKIYFIENYIFYPFLRTTL